MLDLLKKSFNSLFVERLYITLSIGIAVGLVVGGVSYLVIGRPPTEWYGWILVGIWYAGIGIITSLIVETLGAFLSIRKSQATKTSVTFSDVVNTLSIIRDAGTGGSMRAGAILTLLSYDFPLITASGCYVHIRECVYFKDKVSCMHPEHYVSDAKSIIKHIVKYVNDDEGDILFLTKEYILTNR